MVDPITIDSNKSNDEINAKLNKIPLTLINKQINKQNIKHKPKNNIINQIYQIIKQVHSK